MKKVEKENGQNNIKNSKKTEEKKKGGCTIL